MGTGRHRVPGSALFEAATIMVACAAGLLTLKKRRRKEWREGGGKIVGAPSRDLAQASIVQSPADRIGWLEAENRALRAELRAEIDGVYEVMARICAEDDTTIGGAGGYRPHLQVLSGGKVS
jgi:hypothetical protein